MAAPASSKIVVIDDNVEWMQLLCTALSERYEAHGAFNGKEGYELALRVRPDLVLLDIIMPGLTGVEVLRALWHEPRLRAAQVVMMTANQLDAATVELFKKHPNVRGYMRKPCPLSEVIKTADHVLAGRRAAAPAPAAAPAAPKRVYKVLIADDDMPFVQMLGLVINRDDQAFRAADGNQALQWLREGNLPDLMIVDLMMPGMSGIELLRAMKQHAAWSKIPTLIVTAAVLSADQKGQLIREFPNLRHIMEKTCGLPMLQRAIEGVLIRDMAG